MSETVDLESVVARAIEKKAKSWEWASRLVYALVIGAFMFGGWAVALNIGLNQARMDIQELQSQMAQQQAIASQTREDVAVIKAGVVNIDESLKEVKADIKAWTGR